MKHSYLDRLLELRLIAIDDDATLGKVQGAASDVGKKIRSGKVPASGAALLAMDPAASPSDPLVGQVMADLRKHWKTVDQKHPDVPMTLVRGILLEALMQAAVESNVAAAVDLTARSYWPHAALGAETPVWRDALTELASRAEAAAQDAWSKPKSSEVTPPSSNLGKLSAKAALADPGLLQSYLSAAAGPASSPPKDVTPNNNQIISGYGVASSPWANHFGEVAAQGVTNAIREALRGTVTTIDLSGVSQALNEVSAWVGKQIHSAMQPLHALSLRTEVLIWREALYSTSLATPYRALPPEVRILAQAVDLHGIVPSHSPRAVESLLEEAVRAAGDAQAVRLSEFLHAIASARPSALVSAFGKPKQQEGRVPLLALLRKALTSGNAPADWAAGLGVAEDTDVDLTSLATWVFRDLQADRLLSGK